MLDAAASEIIISQNTNNFLIVPPALFNPKLKPQTDCTSHIAQSSSLNLVSLLEPPSYRAAST